MRKLFQSSFREALQGVLEGSEVRTQANARNFALASFAGDQTVLKPVTNPRGDWTAIRFDLRLFFKKSGSAETNPGASDVFVDFSKVAEINMDLDRTRALSFGLGIVAPARNSRLPNEARAFH